MGNATSSSFRMRARLALSSIEILCILGITLIIITSIIPMFKDMRANSFQVTDKAEEKIAAQKLYMSVQDGDFTNYNGLAFYDPSINSFKKSASGITPYGRCKTHNGSLICADFTNGDPVMSWAGESGVTAPDILTTDISLAGIDLFGEADFEQAEKILGALKELKTSE